MLAAHIHKVTHRLTHSIARHTVIAARRAGFLLNRDLPDGCLSAFGVRGQARPYKYNYHRARSPGSQTEANEVWTRCNSVLITIQIHSATIVVRSCGAGSDLFFSRGVVPSALMPSLLKSSVSLMNR